MCRTPSQLSLQNFSCSKCKIIRYLSAAEVAFFAPLDIPAKMQWKRNDECAERHKHVRIAWRQCNTKDTLGAIQLRKRRWAITNEPKIRTVSSQCTARVEGLASTRTVTTLWSEPHGKEEGEEEERKRGKQCWEEALLLYSAGMIMMALRLRLNFENDSRGQSYVGKSLPATYDQWDGFATLVGDQYKRKV